jgi:hypothetical protein
MTENSKFEVYFGEEKVRIESLSYSVVREQAPIYVMGQGHPSPSNFSRSKRRITGTLSGYLTKDYLNYYYESADVTIPEMTLKVREGIKVHTYLFKDVHALISSTYHGKNRPEELTSMLYDMSFVTSDISLSSKLDFMNATNEEIEEHVMHPMDEEFIELPLTLELRR